MGCDAGTSGSSCFGVAGCEGAGIDMVYVSIFDLGRRFRGSSTTASKYPFFLVSRCGDVVMAMLRSAQWTTCPSASSVVADGETMRWDALAAAPTRGAARRADSVADVDACGDLSNVLSAAPYGTGGVPDLASAGCASYMSDVMSVHAPCEEGAGAVQW